MSTTYSAGGVTAYYAAKQAGYTGTFEEFSALMASYATVGQTAVDAKNTAVEKAGEASNSATAANTDALKAEGYAVGKQNGSDVGSGSTYYHANAKYYKEQADSDASAASGSASSASADALKAEGYAQGKQNGSDVASGSPYYHANAKYYSEQAAASAEAAEDSADLAQAAVTALVITDDASGPIASFTDGSDGMPVKSCVVQIEPIQDLHGYDNPWPAGGGKNKCPEATVKVGSTYGARTHNIVFDPPLPAGNYAMSYVVGGTSDGTMGVGFYSERNGGTATGTLNTSTHKVTLTGETKRAYVYMSQTEYDDGKTLELSNIQIESGDTVTSYVPYSNVCPISGHTGANVSACGVNVWDEEYQLGYWNASAGTFVSNSSGYMSSKNPIPVKPNTQYCMTNGKSTSYYIAYYKQDGTFIKRETRNYELNSNGRLFTTPDECYFVNFSTFDTYGTTYNHDISINYLSTDHDYHAYNGTTKSISFGSTIYGGTDEVVSGSGKSTMAIVDLGTLTWEYLNNYQCFKATLSGIKPINNNVVPNAISTMYKAGSWDGVATDTTKNGMFCFLPSYNQIRFRNTAYNDAAQFKTAMDGQKLVYELATPTTFSTTPATLNTVLGDNNIFCDTGNTTVEYVCDPRLFIEKTVAALA